MSFNSLAMHDPQTDRRVLIPEGHVTLSPAVDALVDVYRAPFGHAWANHSVRWATQVATTLPRTPFCTTHEVGGQTIKIATAFPPMRTAMALASEFPDPDADEWDRLLAYACWLATRAHDVQAPTSQAALALWDHLGVPDDIHGTYPNATAQAICIDALGCSISGAEALLGIDEIRGNAKNKRERELQTILRFAASLAV